MVARSTFVVIDGTPDAIRAPGVRRQRNVAIHRDRADQLGRDVGVLGERLPPTKLGACGT